MSNQIVTTEMPILDIASAFVKSGYFQDTRDISQAVVKILAGREFGFGAFASMTGVDIIQGKPSLGADLQASAVKRSARYDYRVREMTEAVCAIEFFERNGAKLESIGVSKFTAEDARKAGTKNMDKYPRNMLFARAISNGVKWYCPDVFGTSVYTPEELGAITDEQGDVITIQATTVTPAPEVSLLEAAKNTRTNATGKLLGELTAEQLLQVIEITKHDDMRKAANIVLDDLLAKQEPTAA